MTRQRAEINNGLSTYIFCGIVPLCNFQYRNCVHTQISVVLLGPDIGILTFKHSFQRLSPGIIYGKKEEKRKRRMKFYKKSHVSITRHRKYMTR